MTDTAKKLSDLMGRYGGLLVTCILCTVSASMVTYIYIQTPVSVYSAGALLFSAALIRLFEYLRTQKAGGVIYLFLLAAVSILTSMFIGSDFNSIVSFIRWFFSGAQAEETRARYMIALTFPTVFFLTSAYYYFTRIIFRSAMLVLVSLIPFALSVKAVVAPPAAYIAVTAALDLVWIIIDGRKKLTGGSLTGGGSVLTVYTDFAAAAVLLALLVPKPSETPYYNKFEEFANRYSFGGSGETVYKGEYQSESGGIDDLLRGESKLLYLITTNDPVYMKTQVFDIYRPETGKWVPLEDMRGDKKWKDTARLLNYSKLGEIIRAEGEADPSFYEKYPFAADFPDIEETESFSVVYSREYIAQYVLSPLRAVEASFPSLRSVRFSARSSAGEIFTNTVLPANSDYTLRYYSETVLPILLESGFCSADRDDCLKLLSDLYYSAEDGTEEKDTILEFGRELKLASNYAENTRTEVSPEIQTLADELTAGLEYDWQKARAIEKYLSDGLFTYDLYYEPPEGMDTPEYFLFESRKGICSDFATAFTLLGRAAGLTVRYVEGFVPKPSEDTANLYTITTENGHAYPEVYIAGAGWVIYEPTAADLTGGRGAGGNDTQTALLTAVFTAVIALAVFGIFLLLVIFAPKIAESIFRIRVKSIGAKNGSKAVIMLYNRFVKNTENRFGKKLAAFTPEQTAAAAEEMTGLSLTPLTAPFSEACYGGFETDRETFSQAYECYIEQAKAMKKIKRRDSK